jgi:hypothetical protein
MTQLGGHQLTPRPCAEHRGVHCRQ